MSSGSTVPPALLLQDVSQDDFSPAQEREPQVRGDRRMLSARYTTAAASYPDSPGQCHLDTSLQCCSCCAALPSTGDGDPAPAGMGPLHWYKTPCPPTPPRDRPAPSVPYIGLNLLWEGRATSSPHQGCDVPIHLLHLIQSCINQLKKNVLWMDGGFYFPNPTATLTALALLQPEQFPTPGAALGICHWHRPFITIKMRTDFIYSGHFSPCANSKWHK